MDEPFVGLDPKASHLLKGMMREICEQGGAIFFSTHVLEVAEKLCDKVAIIKGGKLIRSGTMEEVKGDDSLEDVFLELEERTMLKILLKKQLSEIFRSYFYDAKKNKARSRLATCAYMVFFVVLMVGVLGGLFTCLSAVHVPSVGGSGHGLAVFRADGAAGHLSGRVRQRVQYLFQSLSGQG